MSFRQENREEATVARESSFAQDFYRVYGSCTSSEKLRALKQKHAAAVSKSKYRGFEAIAFYDTLHAKREFTRKQILMTQQQHVSFNFLTLEERAAELGSRSRALTKQSRRLAYVIGSGDAVVARNILSQNEVEKIVSSSLMQGNLLPEFSDSIDSFEVIMCEI